MYICFNSNFKFIYIPKNVVYLQIVIGIMYIIYVKANNDYYSNFILYMCKTVIKKNIYTCSTRLLKISKCNEYIIIFR